MTTKPYVERTGSQTTTIMGLPKPSAKTIQALGMMQLALMGSVGIVRNIALPVLLTIMVGFILIYPWFGDRGFIEVMME